MVECLRSCVLFVLVSNWIFVSADFKVTIENVEYDGYGQFPKVIELLLSYDNKDIYLRLDKDDETTGLLTQSVFDASSFLPSDVFTQRKSKEFAAYDSGDSNVLIVHRETENAQPKFVSYDLCLSTK
ncbi:uncharacterized protein LOC132759168 [Ruditapes philippinarum]|uniref:uncharacterized protein LOC132759168 n=1 Tax=Ruditapes philippinarum TaxID=129788 RepID=UPI00295B65B9|nr:uncharacterized protein LOC132759168 [Ruditapes philippinarum]